MNTPSASADDQRNNSEPSGSDHEAGLRRVLAHISEKPHRRFIAYAIAFVLMFSALETLFSLAYVLVGLLSGVISAIGISPNRVILYEASLLITLVLPLVFTILIFIWLSRLCRTP